MMRADRRAERSEARCSSEALPRRMPDKMDLSYTPEQLQFRDEVRAFLKEAMPPHLRAKAEIDSHFEHHEIMEWHKILSKKGWAAPHWPKEVGGSALDATRRFLLMEEL